MHNSNPNFPYRQSKRSSANTLMDSTQQLIDSLTAHISLYHSKSSPPTTNPNPRSSILKWFSSLTVHQRQSHFTTVDPNFVRILLQMQSKLKSNGGHGLFIILPDIPSRAGKFLPSLCYRKSHGLLARASDCNGSEGLIYQSIRLFNSREGERADECSCSVSYLDSVTVSDKFLENVDEFVAVMDAVSNGGFLRGEETGMFDEWVELEWLKAKGYYSIEAFLANKLEVALRLSWLNCNGGKKRGLKLKEKANLAGVAANVFWRKKGCMDWWTRLDDAMRRNVFQTVLGKAAKYLTVEVLNGTNSALDEEMLPFSSGSKQPLECNSTLSCRRTISTLEGAYTELGVRAASNGRTYLLSYVFNKLLVLQEVSAMMVACQRSDYDKDKLFFSSLGTLRTVSDCILRKLRGLLLLIYLDCTKLELLEEGNLKHSPKKSKDKLVAYGRKKKGKTLNLKQPTSVPRPLKDEVAPGTPAKDNEYGLACTDNVDTIRSSSLVDTLYEKDVDRGTLLPALDMERNEGLVYRNESSASRKNRGKSNKLKKSGLNIQVERGRSQRRTMEVSSSCANLHGEVEKNDRNPECLIAGDIAEGDSNGNTKLEPNPMSCNLISRCSGMENTTQGVQGEFVVSPDGCNGTMIQNTSERVTEDVAVHTRLETGANAADCRIPTCIPAMEDSVVICNEDGNSRNFGHLSKADTKSVIPGKRTNDHGTDEEAIPIPVQQCEGIFDTGTINSLGYISYEWPVHLPSFNSHLPAATDRLHLDVGNNWQNHFHQPFLQTAHQVRNPQIENGHGGMLSRPLPMSSDWPPVVRGFRGLTSPMTCNYDSGFISRRQCSFHHGFTAQSMQHGAMTSEDERIYSAEFRDVPDLPNSQEVADEQDNHWISEEEFEVHAVSGVDYNQYFGGGVMYWDPSDHPGINFSRPPSLSSDDSSWAWREADMNRAVDDMVAISSSYSTNGLTSPSGASFCSPFDPLVPPHQALGYVIPGTEVSGKVLHSTSPLTDVVKEENVSGSLASLSGDGEAKTGDTLHYPILRPIIIPNMSRERSQSDFQRSHDRRSPRVPPSRREQPRIKRPPSPVVLCVPRAPCPPPPSPVGDSRKHRGFPTVRSGSSSPRHWGVRGWFHDGVNFEEACVRMDSSEVVWPSWRNKSLSARQLSQPLPGALLQDHLIAISHLARDQEHPDVAFPLQPHDLVSCSARKASISLMHSLLHDEIDSFYKQVAAENLSRKPYINWAVKRVTRSLQVLWPRSRTNIFGSNATGLSLPSSDVDLVVCLPPVRNLEPIKEAGILEGRNGIKETCLQIPVIMLVVEVPHDLVASAASVIQRQETTVVITDEPGNPLETDMVGLEMSASPQSSNLNTDQHQGVSSIRLDISFKSPSHTGLQTTELVKELTEQFPAATPLAMVLKQFLADRSLDQSYSGGLSSYCLILLITRFLQHEHHHGRPINQNFGSLLMDFLYFFGNVFDPRQIRISVQGSGLYINRERGYSIDPIYIDDPLFPTNNVGRNCFRIHQCIKAFADAYSVLENELTCLVNNGDSSTSPPCRLLPKIIPSIRFS